MSSGGKRRGAGRPKGSVGISTQKRFDVAKQALESGLTPLEYMMERLRDTDEAPAVRLQCARDAAPYVHPRLAAIEHSGGLDLGLSKYTDAELDAALRRAASEAKVVIDLAGTSATRQPA